MVKGPAPDLLVPVSSFCVQNVQFSTKKKKEDPGNYNRHCHSVMWRGTHGYMTRFWTISPAILCIIIYRYWLYIYTASVLLHLRPCLVKIYRITVAHLTTNLEYQVKFNYKTTSTTPCKSRDESNEAFDCAIRGWYCSFTVANHQLITIIRFVSKSYPHS